MFNELTTQEVIDLQYAVRTARLQSYRRVFLEDQEDDQYEQSLRATCSKVNDLCEEELNNRWGR